MEKEASWLYSKSVISVLIELAKKPGTPMQLRIRTGMTKNNYANIILKNLERERLVKCLTPREKIGRIFCVNPESKYRVERIFRKKKISQRVNPLPDLNWKAYGMLLCRNLCTQMHEVFKKAYMFGNEMDFENNSKKKITIPGLQKEKLPKMPTSNIHRAFSRLVEIGIMKNRDAWPREYAFTEDALRIIEFDSSIIQ